MANRPAPALGLREGDREELARLTRSSSGRAGLAQRARIVLLAAEGCVEHGDRGAGRGVAPDGDRLAEPVCQRGDRGFGRRPALGSAADDRPREIVSVTLAPPPKKYGVTHWSSRLLGRHLGISNGTVAKAWREYGVQPWRAETFKFSTDPELVAKVTDVVGLYLAPPENAIVLCVDEKSQIQALDRTAPMLPMRPGLARAPHPRLQAARHHHPVRRVGDRHRQGHRRVQAAAPPPGVPGVPQAGRPGLPRDAGAAPGDGQLRHPQEGRGPRLAGRQPADPRPLHPDLRVLAEPGRGLVRDHRTPSHPPRHLRLRSRTSTPRSAPSSTAGTTAATPSSGPRPPTTSSRKPTVRPLQTRTTSRGQVPRRRSHPAWPSPNWWP